MLRSIHHWKEIVWNIMILSTHNRFNMFVLAHSFQVMAYLTLAAVAAAVQSAIFAKLGQNELQWMKTCTMYGKFCNQSGEGVVSAALASLSMVVLSAISAFSLFRLYGDNRGKNSGGW